MHQLTESPTLSVLVVAFVLASFVEAVQWAALESEGESEDEDENEDDDDKTPVASRQITAARRKPGSSSPSTVFGCQPLARDALPIPFFPCPALRAPPASTDTNGPEGANLSKNRNCPRRRPR
jgi:hypothetical protein